MEQKSLYESLSKLAGKPKTERMVAGTTGLRIDTWECGCVRTLRLDGSQQPATMEEALSHCGEPEHQALAGLAYRGPNPSALQQPEAHQPSMFDLTEKGGE